MAIDKAVDSAWLEAGLKTVCDAIRTKTGSTENLEFPDEMESAVLSISGAVEPDTCTVVIDYPNVKAYSVVVYRDGAYAFECPTSVSAQTITISDVVCGSVIVISSDNEVLNDTTDTTFITYYGNGNYWTHYFRIPESFADQTVTFL